LRWRFGQHRRTRERRVGDRGGHVAGPQDRRAIARANPIPIEASSSSAADARNRRSSCACNQPARCFNAAPTLRRLADDADARPARREREPAPAFAARTHACPVRRYRLPAQRCVVRGAAAIAQTPQGCAKRATKRRSSANADGRRPSPRPALVDTACTSAAAQLVDNPATDPATHCVARSTASRSSPRARREPALLKEFIE